MKRLLPLLILIAFTAACGKTGVCKTLGGRGITEGEWDYVFGAVTRQYELYGAFALDWDGEIEGVPARDYLTAQAELTILKAYALEDLAAELDCALTAEEKSLYANVEKNVWALRYGYHIPGLRDKVMDMLFPGGEGERENVRAYFQEQMVFCQYLYLSLRDDDGVRLGGEDKSRLLSVLTALQKQAAAGADFTVMIDDHGQDYAMSQSPGGIAIDLTLYGEDFAEAVKALQTGEISPVLETEDGLFIVRRLEGGEAWFDKHYEEIHEAYRYAELDRILTERIGA